MSQYAYTLTADPAWPWWLLALVALILVGLTVWTYLGVPRAGRRIGVVIALRLGALLLACVALARPSLASREDLKVPSTLLILIDSSESMTVQDEFNSQSRWDALRRVLARCEPTLQQLQEEQNVKVHFYRFAEQVGDFDPKGKADGKRTDYGEALQTLHKRHGGERHFRGLLLLSDGLDNGTRYKTSEEAAKWRASACPLHTFVVGQATTASDRRDVIVTALTPEPSPVRVKNKLIVHGRIDAPGFENTPVKVRLKINDKEVAVDQITLKRDKDNEVTLTTQAPDNPGEIKVTLSVDGQIGEATLANNEISTYVTVIKEGLRVLYVDRLRLGEPNAIRAALRDPRINLTMLYRQSEEPLSPAERAALDFTKQHYDAIILGDVSARRLSGGDTAVLQGMHEAVRKKGVGLMTIGGYLSFGNSDWQDVKWADPKTGEERRFADLFPVELNVSGQDDGDIKLRPTPAGLAYYVMRLSDKPAENGPLWDKLPALKGYTKMGRVKTGAHLMATGADPKADVPLLVSGQFNEGRTLAFAADTTWRWRNLGLPDKAEGIPLHERFWRQAVLWLAKHDESSSSVWVSLDARRLPSGAKLGFSAGARGKEGEPLPNARFEATITDPQGGRTTVPVAREGEDYRGTYWKTDVPGEYHVEVRAFAAGQTQPLEEKATARFLVYQDTTELQRQAADPSFLAKLAATGGGKAYRLEDLPRLLQEMRSQPLASAKPKTELWPDWRRTQTSGFLPAFFLAFVALLSVEWLLRRRWGLV